MENKETQTFISQKWLIILFLGVHLFQIYQISYSLSSHYLQGKSLYLDKNLVVSWCIFLVFTVLFFRLKLTTQFVDSYVVIRYWPFLWRPLQISKEDIKQIEIRTYKPLLEFGGWGYRIGWNGFTAYSTHGKTGVFIEYKQGKKVMIGTQKPDIWEKWVEENQLGK